MYSNVFLLNHHVVIRLFCREMTFSGMTLATFITFFHLCTHQKQKFRNDELYQPSFASAPGARCCVKKLKWWQYLMP